MRRLLENLPNSRSRKLNVRMGRKYADNMWNKKQLSCQTHNKHTITEFTHFCLIIQNAKQSIIVYHFV